MRAVAFVFTFFFLAGSLVDFREWSKLPDLAVHFQEHRVKNPSISFAQFLFLHYGAGADQHQREEPVQHEQLPFGASVQVLTVLFCPYPQPTIDRGSCWAVLVSFNFSESSLLSIQATQSIWQPPRA
jgi:hypothetical protein